MNIYKSQEEIYNLLVPELFKIGFTQSTYEPEFSFITFKNESEHSIKYIRINFYTPAPQSLPTLRNKQRRKD